MHRRINRTSRGRFGRLDRRPTCRGAASTGSTPLSQERREAFWRRRGWRPELPEHKRKAIECEWDDMSIELAEFHGF